MNSEYSWKDVKRTVQGAKYCALATIAPDGTPQMTPIGCIHLTEEGRGFFIEEHPSLFPERLGDDGSLAIVAVGGAGSAAPGREKDAATRPHALRLVVKASRRRLATASEAGLWRRLTGPFRWLRGHTKLLRRELSYVRDFTVDAVSPVHLGAFSK